VTTVTRIDIQKVKTAHRATWHSNKRPVPIVRADPRIVKTVLSERLLVGPATREAWKRLDHGTLPSNDGSRTKKPSEGEGFLVTQFREGGFIGRGPPA
jgi:hypothetical protein